MMASIGVNVLPTVLLFTLFLLKFPCINAICDGTCDCRFGAATVKGTLKKMYKNHSFIIISNFKQIALESSV